jgi:Zn-dependent protease
MKNIRINQSLADQFISIALLLFCGLVLLEIRHFSEYGRYFPKIVTLFLLVFSFVYFLKSWLPRLIKKESSAQKPYELVKHLPSFMVCFGGILVYIFVLFSLLGFLASSIVFCIGVIIGVQITRAEASFKSAVTALITSSAFSFVMYYIFRQVFNSRLP